MKREKILKELKILKENGFTVNIGRQNLTLTNGTVMAGAIVNGNASCAIDRVKSKMSVSIDSTDNEDTIADKINEAKEVLKEYKELVEHQKNTPDLIDYLRYNLEE